MICAESPASSDAGDSAHIIGNETIATPVGMLYYNIFGCLERILVGDAE